VSREAVTPIYHARYASLFRVPDYYQVVPIQACFRLHDSK